MRRDLELLVRAVEVAGASRVEICVRQDDGLVRSPRGNPIGFEEAEALWRAPGTIPVFLSETELV
jgi:hypothetical protein